MLPRATASRWLPEPAPAQRAARPLSAATMAKTLPRPEIQPDWQTMVAATGAAVPLAGPARMHIEAAQNSARRTQFATNSCHPQGSTTSGTLALRP
jgi:hypothetical protein